jgi:glycosyltransferase involved in cell wall biosynthesis
MRPLHSVAFVGNYLPRRCGIATFTTDLHRAVCEARPDIETAVVAMTDVGCDYHYPSAVRVQICDANVGEYIRASSYLNNQNFEVVCLQHEYGIFGGEAGEYILKLLSGLEMPLVTTLHTVLAKPSLSQRAVMGRIVDASAKVVVMAQKGRELLRSVFDVPDHKIEVIEHGIPDFPFVEPEHAKAKMGFAGKKIILTFGLLSPSKGIETVIDAMPSVIASCPNAVYVVLGATHPNLLKSRGEEYRNSLVARVQALGIAEHVVFLNEFVDQHQLLDFISMCDVYVTPYLNEAQMTSGTLAYSFGLGKAVVSTPYWHAQELLADGRGILVPFGNSERIGREISKLLTSDERRNAMRARAYAESRSMVWEHTAAAYTRVFEAARLAGPSAGKHSANASASLDGSNVDPEVKVDHFLSMCDGTGMLQHSIHSVADRIHG